MIATGLSSFVLGRNLIIFSSSARNPQVQSYGGLDDAGLSGGASRNGMLWVYAALVVHVVFALLLKLYFFQGADVRDLQGDVKTLTPTKLPTSPPTGGGNSTTRLL